MKIIIEPDVPVPRGRGDKSKYAAALEAMTAGSSFEFPVNDAAEVAREIRKRREAGKTIHFITRKWSDTTRRCWRIS